MKRFDYIDALRGYAIMGVLIVHVGLATGLGPTVAWGARGVQLFFVVSAMTLFASWRERNDGAAPFYIRRLLRIAPMFWIAAAFYGLAYSAPIDRWEAVSTVLFVNGLHPATHKGIVPGGWSVADEMLFYALLPAIAALITNWKRAAALGIVALCLSKIYVSPGVVSALQRALPDLSYDTVGSFVLLSLPAQGVTFAAGILAYFLSRMVPKTRVSVVAAEFVLLAAIVGLVRQPSIDEGSLGAYAILFGGAAGAMSVGAGRWLVNPVICHLGKISFSVYLIHFALTGPCATAVSAAGLAGAAGFPAVLLLVTLATAVIATLTFKLIEQPGIRLGRSLARRAAGQAPARIAPA